MTKYRKLGQVVSAIRRDVGERRGAQAEKNQTDGSSGRLGTRPWNGGELIEVTEEVKRLVGANPDMWQSEGQFDE